MIYLTEYFFFYLINSSSFIPNLYFVNSTKKNLEG